VALGSTLLKYSRGKWLIEFSIVVEAANNWVTGEGGWRRKVVEEGCGGRLWRKKAGEDVFVEWR